MNFYQLKYFSEVVRPDSISLAAQSLHISQPALSKIIKNLESELGQPILIRSNRGISPTELGQKIYNDFLIINDLIEEWYVQKTPNIPTGKVHVGCIASGSNYLMNNIVFPFTTKYPKIDIILHHLNVQLNTLRNIEKMPVSIAIVSIPPNEEANYMQQIKKNNWAYHKLFTDERRLLINSSHPLAKQDELTLYDLKGLSIAYYSQGQDAISTIYEQYFASSYKLASRENIIELVMNNNVAFMTVFHLMRNDHYIKNGLLKDYSVPIPDFQAETPIIAIFKNNLTFADNLFADYLLDNFAKGLVV